jgi:hypothetical protein
MEVDVLGPAAQQSALAWQPTIAANGLGNRVLAKQ